MDVFRRDLDDLVQVEETVDGQHRDAENECEQSAHRQDKAPQIDEVADTSGRSP